MLQAGCSTGKTLTDNCEIMAKLPELQAAGYETLSFDCRVANVGLTNNPFCRIDTPFLTQFKGLGTYMVPKVDVLIAATLQSFAGPERIGELRRLQRAGSAVARAPAVGRRRERHRPARRSWHGLRRARHDARPSHRKALPPRAD